MINSNDDNRACDLCGAKAPDYHRGDCEKWNIVELLKKLDDPGTMTFPVASLAEHIWDRLQEVIRRSIAQDGVRSLDEMRTFFIAEIETVIQHPQDPISASTSGASQESS